MLASRGPLATLLSAEAPSSAELPDPLELLGWMLELRGTVRMCSLLDERPPPRRPPRAGPRAGAGDPLWRMRHIQALALRPLRDPLGGRHALADPTRTLDLLVEAGLFGRRHPGKVEAAADEMAAAFHQALGARIAIARAAVAELRRQISEWLRPLGPAASYLEALDAALRESTETRAQQLFDRVAPALHQRFRDRLWRAVQALPEEPTLDDVSAWYGRGGWIDDHLRACRRVVAGVCRHEARALEALVAAAQEIAIDPENDS